MSRKSDCCLILANCVTDVACLAENTHGRSSHIFVQVAIAPTSICNVKNVQATRMKMYELQIPVGVGSIPGVIARTEFRGMQFLTNVRRAGERAHCCEVAQ